jgi:hypothetical protein
MNDKDGDDNDKKIRLVSSQSADQAQARRSHASRPRSRSANFDGERASKVHSPSAPSSAKRQARDSSQARVLYLGISMPPAFDVVIGGNRSPQVSAGSTRACAHKRARMSALGGKADNQNKGRHVRF